MTQHTALLNETQSADAMLRARARLVVPGGMWGHLNAARLPEGYPQFFASAEGCRVRDVDGREYVDFMCSWGPILLGHRHPEVQAAAEAQPLVNLVAAYRAARDPDRVAFARACGIETIFDTLVAASS